MADTHNVVAKDVEVQSGVKSSRADAVAQGLADVLADTYRLTIKTHACHWNVEGPLFYAVHNLTEGQYENMFAAADELAERIRALGRLAPMSMAAMLQDSVVKDLDGKPAARDMVADLAEDHTRIAKRLHALIQMADEARDDVTADLATARSAFHEKTAWMLRATVAE